MNTDADRKAEATLQAEYARIAWELRPLPDGEYLAIRWNNSRHLPHLQAAADFYRRISGRST